MRPAWATEWVPSQSALHNGTLSQKTNELGHGCSSVCRVLHQNAWSLSPRELRVEAHTVFYTWMCRRILSSSSAQSKFKTSLGCMRLRKRRQRTAKKGRGGPKPLLASKFKGKRLFPSRDSVKLYICQLGQKLKGKWNTEGWTELTELFKSWINR